jgi:hypothetical protein
MYTNQSINIFKKSMWVVRWNAVNGELSFCYRGVGHTYYRILMDQSQKLCVH